MADEAKKDNVKPDSVVAKGGEKPGWVKNYIRNVKKGLRNDRD